MERLIFPVFAVGGTFFVLIPLLTIIARLVFPFIERYIRSDHRTGANLRLFLLLAPVWLPLIALFSSTAHYLETFQHVHRCLLDHSASGLCLDAPMIAICVMGITGFTVFPLKWATPTLNRCDEGSHAQQTLTRLSHNLAIPTGTSLIAVHGANSAVQSIGRIFQTIAVDTSFIEEHDDSVLLAAIRHELSHCRNHDLLSRFFVRWSEQLNPATRLLRPVKTSWLASCELASDREAVDTGTSPLDLSTAIIAAARTSIQQPAENTATLAHGNMASLRARLSLLALLGSHRSNGEQPWFERLPLIRASMLAAFVVPHLTDSHIFDHIHHVSESLLLGGVIL